MSSVIQLKSLPFSSPRTYVSAAAFIVANILFPQLFHAVPQGGMIWLPIYFFTLIGSYIYGWRVGLLTALASPLLSSLIFGMPAAAALPAITVKSALLAAAAGYAAYRFGRATVAVLLCVVLSYQVAGTLVEWAIMGDFALACSDFRIGVPGMLLQIFGGYAVLRRVGDR
ncbi:MAG: ECF transporter S component [Muribaculaceae bacterium]|nr:ECF transporter S component [Muribaculaceae bacterium]